MKKVIYLLCFASLLCTGCDSQPKITLKDQIICEYGQTLSEELLFDTKQTDKDVQIKRIINFDNKKLDTQTIKVLVKNSKKKEKELTVNVTVKDTKFPVIKLRKKIIDRTVDEELDLESNIESVKDPVDGDIPYVKGKSERNGYFISYNEEAAKKPGTYEVSVIAYDQNANMTKEVFQVKINEKAKEATTNEIQPPTEIKSVDSKVINKQDNNTNNKKQNTPSTNKTKPSSNDKKQPSVCVPNGTYDVEIGNSNKLFKTSQEADSWAQAMYEEMNEKWNKGEITKEEANKWDGWYGYTLTDSCGNNYWTIEWMYQ